MDTTDTRIDGTLLQSNQGKIVRIVGKLDTFDGNSGILQSNGNVALDLSNVDSNIEVNKNFEIIGRVTEGLKVVVFSVTDISDNFNFDNYYKLCKFINQVPELF
ncbi:putative replication factor A protein 3 [[Candida] jaroonii]|uniref:Replication factor A protein 3 n=1 Tax=[Candida] jaroonii TaxID=467808 RepID=A0ACA9Y1M8_9ASCO|nr:putative replication factor A protein 3 [[Candida] jaroonii]